MEFYLVVFMILGGMVLSGIVFGFLARADRHRQESETRTARFAAIGEIEASIVYSVSLLGGASEEEVWHAMEREAGLQGSASVIDVPVWSDAYKRKTDLEARRVLLENVVRVVVAVTPTIPLVQYNALLELSFALGFKTDALARLRARYRFEYIDYARERRPREADRSGRETFFRREDGSRETCLAELGLDETVSRHELIGTYRHLASEHHPDRFHEADAEERLAAADRFIRITEAYEGLLAELDRGV